MLSMKPSDSGPFSYLTVETRVQSVDAYATASLRPLEGSNRSVELPKALEGDLWKLSLAKKKRRLHLLEASLVEEGSGRLKPRCEHFSTCGGCQWQHVSDKEQRLRKEALALSYLKPHFVQDTRWNGVDSVDSTWRYRNKIELTFRQNLQGDKFLGFHAGKYRVVDVKACHLAGSWSEKAIQHARQWWLESGLQAYHPGSDRGSLRSLTLRESRRSCDKMAILTVSGNSDWALSRAQMDSFDAAMKASIQPGDILSVYLIVHQAIAGQATRLFEWHLSGPEAIRERLHIPQQVQRSSACEIEKNFELEFAISPTTFFQPNTLSAEKLYAWALSFVREHVKDGVVWDLFCGSGTLSLALAKISRQVIGVEINPMAVLDAKANAEKNGLVNASFECFDLHKSPHLAIEALIEKSGRPDCVVVDPPRAGVMEKGIALLAQMAPEVILYVSCNPATQAKDIEGLRKSGYQLLEAVAVDQFPHTGHIETVCLLKKIS